MTGKKLLYRIAEPVLLAALLTITIALATPRHAARAPTLLSHFPVFLVIAWASIQAIPGRWRSALLGPAAALLSIEILALAVA